MVFQGQSNALAPNAYAALDSLAQILREQPAIVIEVQSFMDDKGNARLLLQTSQSRAEAVRSYLLLKGAKPGQVIARGMGSANPIASNSTGRGRLLNRRIEVDIIRGLEP